MKSKYKLTLDEWEKLLKSQSYQCAICHIHLEQISGHLCIDHDHKTKKIRGLLCKPCNGGIGMFQDSAPLLRDAAEYLEKHSGEK
jgi:nitrate/TMAO reductase-like tetraheme cytochrome c subunit